ncbi:WecB/TagA/CpsF family glycosyltransferase [Clostridium perfringens]|uniref:WecB/TagA/CpsF family glycosyltransferase n=1 Tax=Clostridium perfringens TaxID=1502 RepID=UPI0024BD4A07|nr:WecB/TagA/CpsF family glycosyltransferase [Clostridium perfringens]MDK0750903.1 WecB/TagA/CpsF family glycosyltransferase [Clostridium perfringens]MDM0888531.1 WecB/TagA/CpsF family glycosyltransferase [Clostridium perfringens]MDM0900348.1 WecB/TagA/CpsF family glycosyltransferase [Clostridium perfringens]MDM0909131.1 WecB/TagA/CpsF family glycosyltransferase [Clostridium perfringens]MDM0914822.1 WecB/TagA/CpsF family glycosyltransferase [Clostridium perfringens]
MKKCSILGVNIAVTNMDDTVNYIEENLNELKGNYICVSNVHTTVISYEDDEYKKIQNEGALALPDGGPLSYVSRKRGFKEAKRVTGPDLMGRIFSISEKKGYTHFFYGSTPEVLSELRINLKKKYPKLNIVGMYSPPFKKEVSIERETILNDFEDCDFLWVGLGAPKQEKWMNLHRGKVNSIMIGVGAGFDYYAERIQRAPKWMQDNNLEWLYRLIQDPRRLFKRYFVTNFKFIKNAIILKK